MQFSLVLCVHIILAIIIEHWLVFNFAMQMSISIRCPRLFLKRNQFKVWTRSLKGNKYFCVVFYSFVSCAKATAHYCQTCENMTNVFHLNTLTLHIYKVLFNCLLIFCRWYVTNIAITILQIIIRTLLLYLIKLIWMSVSPAWILAIIIYLLCKFRKISNIKWQTKFLMVTHLYEMPCEIKYLDNCKRNQFIVESWHFILLMPFHRKSFNLYYSLQLKVETRAVILLFILDISQDKLWIAIIHAQMKVETVKIFVQYVKYVCFGTKH